MATKEQGILTYLQVLASQTEPSEQQQRTIIASVQACYELFARNMDLVRKDARIQARSNVPYHELYQEGAMQLMETIVVQGYDNTGLHNFRFVATEMIRHYKGRGTHILYQFFRQPVNYPHDYFRDRPRLTAATGELESELGRTPKVDEIAKQMGARVDKVLGLMALSAECYRLDQESVTLPEYVPPEFHDPDFTNQLLEQIEQEAAIKNIFGSEKLTAAEKVVLSIHYQIFQPALCGVEITDGKTIYLYPETLAEFTTLTTKQRTLHSLGLDVFGFNGHFAINRHENALRKARTILESDASFDIYGLTDTTEARQAAEQEDAERQQIVAWALKLSPHKRLGKKELEALFKSGDSPYSRPRISKLFGTIAAFQEACGFEPDKGRSNRGLSVDEVIKRALQLKPDGPMGADEIRELSKQGAFVGYGVVKRLFGTLPAFQKACGFEPIVQTPRQNPGSNP